MPRLPHRTAERLAATVLGAAVTYAAIASARFANTADEADQRVRFRTVAGLHGVFNTRIPGTATGVTAREDHGRITFTAPVAKLDTGNNMRNHHLRERFKADRYPNIVLAVERSHLKAVEDNQAVTGNVTGDFTLAGTTRPVTVAYRVNRTGSDYHVRASFRVNINNFGLETPCFAGVCVDPNVDVTIDRYKLRDQ
jgi:polyisoprenoid-binding protein YceI